MKYYVYVVCSTECYFKVGVAKNPARRLTELQTGNPEELQIDALVLCPNEKAAYALEILLHEKFSRRKVRNEWFSFGKRQKEIRKGRQNVYNTIIDVVSHPDYRKSFRITKWPNYIFRKETRFNKIDKEEVLETTEEYQLMKNHMREILLA
jgi:hypothetical protein